MCGHDEMRHVRSMEDVRCWFSAPCTGSVETAAAPFWRLLPAGVRVVTVHRPVDEILPSLRRAGMQFDEAIMRRHLAYLASKLRQIERRLPDVLSLSYADLATEEGCARLFEHCLPYQHDSAWWQAMAPINMQINLGHALHWFAAYRVPMEKTRRIARWEMLRGLRRPVAMDGVVFQQETLAQAFSDRDGQRLMGDECAVLGEYPEAWQHMNIPLLQRLEEKGALHIMTARSNGRMFGYVVSALGEAFFALDQCEAEQVAFFADPSWPGLGRKLQHASIEDLRARGVNRVMMFQPDETRVGLVYRRLGAKQTGQRYVLELQ